MFIITQFYPLFLIAIALVVLGIVLIKILRNQNIIKMKLENNILIGNKSVSLKNVGNENKRSYSDVNFNSKSKMSDEISAIIDESLDAAFDKVFESKEPYSYNTDDLSELLKKANVDLKTNFTKEEINDAWKKAVVKSDDDIDDKIAKMQAKLSKKGIE